MEDKNKIMYIKKIYMHSHLVVDLPIFYYDCVFEHNGNKFKIGVHFFIAHKINPKSSFNLILKI